MREGEAAFLQLPEMPFPRASLPSFGDGHPHRMALQGSKANKETHAARRDLAQSAVSLQDPGAKSQRTKKPRNQGGRTAGSNGQQRSQCPDAEHETIR